MIDFHVSGSWLRAYSGAVVGTMLVENIHNRPNSAELKKVKIELENHIRTQFNSRDGLQAQPVLQAYQAYYKLFQKNYHVLFQLESIALKGKSIPDVNALVESMFMAELKNMLLTAGHDFNSIEAPITLDIAEGTESAVLLNGKEQVLKAGDMIMSDARGIISSVIYGPDGRTRITDQTVSAFFVVYCPPGVGREKVETHLLDIKTNIDLFSPDAEMISLETIVAE